MNWSWLNDVPVVLKLGCCPNRNNLYCPSQTLLPQLYGWGRVQNLATERRASCSDICRICSLFAMDAINQRLRVLVLDNPKPKAPSLLCPKTWKGRICSIVHLANTASRCQKPYTLTPPNQIGSAENGSNKRIVIGHSGIPIVIWPRIFSPAAGVILQGSTDKLCFKPL